MRLPEFLRLRLLGWAQGVMASRPPDVKIGDEYVHRWMLLPKRNPLSKFFNIYIHRFGRDDDDGALHDHETDNLSLILENSYREHFHEKPIKTVLIRTQIADDNVGRIELAYKTKVVKRRQGDMVFRLATTPHRIELYNTEVNDEIVKVPVTTLFVQGPRRRKWGFHCVNRGWVPWDEYIDTSTKGYGSRTGQGCGQ